MKNSLITAFVCWLLVTAHSASAQINLLFSSVAPTCHGFTNGTATVTPSGGAGPYNYHWGNGQSGQTNLAIGAGIHYVTVTDLNSQTATGTVTVMEPNPLTTTVTVSNIPCANYPDGGALHAVVLGGTAPYTVLWNDGNTDVNRLNMPAGTYFVTATDAHNCTAVAQGTITMPTPISVVAISVTPSCGGGNNGSATILAVGGTPPYTHTWTPGGYTGTSVSGLAPGIYYVCTMDANNCQKDLWVNIPEIPNLDVSLTVQSAVCTGVNDGVVTAFVNPPGNYQYQWNLPPFTGVNQLTGLAANTVVSVTVTDPISGCSGTATTTVPAHTAITVSVIDTDIPCAGQNIGSASATASGGTPNYQYVWISPPSSQIGVGPTISGLAPGAYMVSVTDSKGCTATGVADIGVLSDPKAIIGGSTTVLCDSVASVVQFVNLSTDLYDTIVSWVWTITTPTDTLTFANISPLQLTLPVGVHGTAHLMVTSSQGCVAEAIKSFTVPGIPNISLNTGDVVTDCSNGPVHIIVHGGQPFYTYTWSPLTGLTLDSIPPNAIANPLVTTTYQLIASDQGCNDTVWVKIVRGDSPLELTVEETVINTCDSTVVLLATANTPNIVWINAVGDTLGNPPYNPVTVIAGATMVYTAIATDTTGCIDSISVTVTGHGVDVDVDPTIPDVVCLGTIVPLGLINNHPGDTLQYVWTVTPPMIIVGANSSNPTVTGPVGEYNISVIVTNQFNCSDTLTIPLQIDNMLSIEDSISINLCEGKKVSFFNNSSVMGVWYFGDGDSSLLHNPMHTYSAAGAYDVSFVPIDSACISVWDSTIHVQDMPLFPPIIGYEYISCIDSAVIHFTGFTISSVLSWHWTFSFGSPDTSSLANPLITFSEEGTVTAILKITDINGCMASDTMEVPVVFIHDILPDTLFVCIGDSVQLNADGHDSTATYLWTSVPADPALDATNPNPTVFPSVATVYTVVISLDSLCTVTHAVTVIPVPGPDVSPVLPYMGCAGGEILMWLINNDPTQVLHYQWSANPPLVLTGSTLDTVTVVGPAGNYEVTVTVTNQYNCSVTLTLPLLIDSSQITQDSITMNLCEGKKVSFFNGSSVMGVWYFGDGDSSLLHNPMHTYDTAGIYHVSFIPINMGCILPWDSTIHVQDMPLDTPGIGFEYITCIDSAVIQFIGSSNNPNVTWAWTFSFGTPGISSEQNPMVTFTQEGNVTAILKVTDINGCMASDTVEVPVVFIHDILPDTLFVCIGDSVQLNADGHDSTATYLWTSVPVDPALDATNPNPTVFPSVATVYTVIISQDTLCTVTHSVTVIPLPGPDVSPVLPYMGCAGGEIQMWLINNDPTQVLHYQWSANPPLVLTGSTLDTVTVVGPAGNYEVTVTVTNQYNCSVTLTLPLQIDSSQMIQDSITKNLCEGRKVSFFNSSNVMGVWYFGDGDSSLLHNPMHTYDTAGIYHVSFIPINMGCILPWDSTIHVQDMPLDTPGIGFEYVTCLDSAVIQFLGSSNNPNVTWSWTFSFGTPGTSSEQNPMVTFTQEGNVTAILKVTDINGCMASDTVEVPVVFIHDILPDTLFVCIGDSVQLNADGYDSTATYLWTSVPVDPALDATNPNPTVFSSVATVYTVVISQDTLCTVTHAVTVIPVPGPDVSPVLPYMGCAGEEIQMWLINNDPSQVLHYQWSADPPLVLTGSTLDTVTVVGPAGNYEVTVTVTNQYNCSVTLTLPLQIDSSQMIPDSITMNLCEGKKVSFFNSSSVMGVWYFGDGDSSLLHNPMHTYDTAGIYHVSFMPINMVCIMPWDSTIHVQDMPLDTPGIGFEYVTCIDSAVIQFLGSSNSPNVTWSWTFSFGTPATSSEQNPMVTFMQEGNVTAILKVTDINGCMASDTVEVPVVFIHDILPDTLFVCIGDSVQLNADGYDSTATYLWTSVPVDPALDATNPNPTVFPSVATVYTVVISQDTLCTVTHAVTVIPVPGPDVSPVLPYMGCAWEEIQMWLINNDPTQVLQYQWSADLPLELADAHSDTVKVVGPAGNYEVTVTVTNQYNCSVTLTLPLQIDSSQMIQDSITMNLCEGKKVSFFNSSSVMGVWYFGDGDSSLLHNPMHTYDTAGIYHVSFMPINMVCIMPWDSMIQVQDMPLDTPMIGFSYITCSDSAQIQFMGTSNNPNVTWAWTFSAGVPDTSSLQNPVVTFMQEDTITAILKVTDINGCMASDTVEIVVTFIHDILPDTLMICIGDSIQLNADGHDSTATYLWTSVPFDSTLISTDPNPWVSPNVITVYTVVISQDTLCSVIGQVVVVPKDGLDLQLPADMVVCNDDSVTITAGGNGMNYEWSLSLTFDSIIATGPTITIFPTNVVYYVRANGLTECAGLDSIRIINGAVSVAVGPYDNDICIGESTVLLVNNLNPDDELNYAWSPTLPNVPNPTVSPTESTAYHVVVSNQYGCIAELDFQVNVTVVSVIAEIVGKDTICTGELASLLATPFGNGAPYTFEWSPPSGLSNPNIASPMASPDAGQVYVVTVTTANGCTATDQVILYYCIDQCVEPYIFVPKAFTPNGDSNNDFFRVRGSDITELLFIVWDRWGEKVYETSDIQAQGWDGTYKGKELTPDSYAWYLRARCGNGTIFTKKGDVTLLK